MEEFNEENRLENMNDNEWGEIDWSEVNSDEQEESIWNDINWNGDETGEQEESIWNEIDWEESENEKQTESDSNDADGEIEPEQLDPNEFEENCEGNEYEQYERESNDESNYDSYEYGDNFGQEEYSGGFYENSYAEAMNTILLSESQIYEYLQEYIQLMVEKENEVKQGEQAEVDNSKEEPSELEKFLEEERERIRLEQQQADLDEIIENEAKSELVPNEEEVEREQVNEVRTQENISKGTVSNNEDEVDSLEMELEEELQLVLSNESIKSDKFEETEEENEESQPNSNEENIEEQENNLKMDDEKNEEYEQHQYEAKIEEEHEIELESIIHEEEMELIKEEHKEKEDHEVFIKEGELRQLRQELDVNYEVKSSETEALTIHQEELEREITSSYEEEEYREIEEFEDLQQELEEILEQNRKIEQQALLEIEKEEIDSDKPSEENYERAKKLYHQQTGKRPIYANKETKGFNEWLEQNNESGGKLKGEQSKEQKMEQEKEEVWISFLKNWIKKESREEISLEMKVELNEILENYNELEKLATEFMELYKKDQLEQLSQSEKLERMVLTKKLEKFDPIKIFIFTNLRAIKQYLNNHSLDSSEESRFYRILNQAFTHLSQKNKLYTEIGKLNLYKTRNLIEDLRNEIQQLSEELALIFPERLITKHGNKYSHQALSQLWGRNEKYVSSYVIKRVKEDPGFTIKEKDLIRLKEKIEELLGVKAKGCFEIIKKYQNNELDTLQLINMLEEELGRVSGEIKVTDKELGMVLTGTRGFIKNLFTRIMYPSHHSYNPHYKFSKERLSEIKAYLYEIFGHKSNKCIELLKIYEKLNPDLKKYSLQQYTITRPNYFYDIEKHPEKSYWFGFLSADATRAEKTGRITIELALKDKELLEKFAKAVGLPINRIKSRLIYRRYKGVLKEYKTAILRFACKPMGIDLDKLGFRSSKNKLNALPNYVIQCLNKAKKKSKRENIGWWQTLSGKVALGYLLGFYDGDGTYKGGKSAGIYAKNKTYLNHIKELFEIKNKIITTKIPGEIGMVFDQECELKGCYRISLGPKLFEMMMKSYEGSLKRKRP